MSWEDIVNIALGAGGIKIIELFLTRGKTRAETKKVNADASDAVVDTMLEAMQFLRAERIDYLGRIESLEKSREESDRLIQELQAHRNERTRQIEVQARQIEDLQEKNEALLSQVAALTAQRKIDHDEVTALRQQVSEWEEKYNRARLVIEKLVRALKGSGVPVPGDVDLSDSITGWKWEQKP